jgi:Flp pilus assembly protein TadG
MSLRARARLGEERGQSLVFFVLSMGALFALVAIVVNVGGWLRAARQAQAVADTSALAAAQDPANAQTVAQAYADQNWPGVNNVTVNPSTPTPNQTDIFVHTERVVPALFGSLIGIPGVTVSAHAVARTEVASTVNDVAPIALQCDAPFPGAPCDPWPIGSTASFQFRSGNPIGFGPFQLYGGMSTTGFRKYLACDPHAPSETDCYGNDLAAGSSFASLNVRTRDLQNWLDTVVGAPARLVAIYDRYSSGRFDVVGWAAFSVTSVTRSGTRRNRTVTLRGRFESLFLDSTRLSSGGAGGPAQDFGVRAVGLSG